MTYLTAHLPFPSGSSLPPPASHLVISDTLNSPAQFALYHLVNAALLKQKSQPPSLTQARQINGRGTEYVTKVVWVDFRSEGRSSWEVILKKLGTPLPSPTSPAFIHITPSSLPACISSSSTNANSPRIFPSLSLGTGDATSDRDGRPTLKHVYDTLLPHLQTQAQLRSQPPSNPEQGEGGSELECLLILDGLSDLLSIGVPLREIHRFVRAVYAQIRISKAALVSTLHTDSLSFLTQPSLSLPLSESETETNLLERLLKIGHGVWWRVENLQSGRSGDVMGEISSHPFGTHHSHPNSNFRAETEKDTYIPRSKPLQYRLEPSTVRVFAKGTGRGFL
ncbi:hypothetical protein CNH00130 [Cryptococcus deneoformans JEC21]|uniref:Elongator complex protein 5 n=1 Tax=Cryptococcus deneoformans (strain JEC21 / ATCC MYA-565) TaxID=214684 RepID=Q5KC85_CRYD1|nr:hypothetical protein CNH00130 [Cryptococcus neoformans var. neoformans JEC21]AAW44900.1 hypothetical protein CNH00130 [Cryptococcus neoformans var. neoformans JEC21]